MGRSILLKNAKKSLVLQYNQSWCGLACMASAVKFFGGIAKQEQMVAKSGTTITGTTLLGLYQLAPELGLKAEGYEASIESLKEIQELAILHTIRKDGLQHYILCYGWIGTSFLIGDPATGVFELSENELNEIWKSKALLTISPGNEFVKAKEVNSNRWNLVKQLTRDDWGILGIALCMGIVLAGLGLSLAIFSQKLVDKILPGGDVKRLIAALVIVSLLLLMKNYIGYLRGLLLVRQSRDFGNRVISWFFGISILLPKSFFDSLKTGDMVARMNDVRRLQQVVNSALSAIVIDFLGLVASLILLFGYSWELGAVSLAAIVVFPVITSFNSLKIKNYQQQVMISYATSESSFVNTIQGIEAIKVTRTESVFSEKVSNAYSDYQEKNFDLGIFGNKLGLIFQTAATAILMAVIAAGSYGVLDSWLSVGELVAAISLAATVVGTTASLSLSTIQYQEANVAFNRLFEFVQGPKELVEEVVDYGIKVNAVSLDAVSFRYPGRSLLLDRISIEIKRGEIACLLGDIGAGKSTLLQILQRFYQPQNGLVKINGADWSTISTGTIRHVIISAPQEVRLFNATLVENIAMSSDQEELIKVESFCKEYGFDRFFSKLPLSLLTPVGEDGVNLSGGQKQLLGIARVLFRKPQLLLLDEPTSSLDEISAGFIMDLFKRIKENMGILIVTHYKDLVGISDRVYKLSNGKLEGLNK